MVLNLHEAKTRLSSPVDLAAEGAEIVMAKNGRPLAQTFRQVERPQS